MTRATMAAAKPSPETNVGELSTSARKAVAKLAEGLESLRRRIAT